MPVFNVTSPDGRIVEVTAPEGATEQQAIEYAQSHWESLSKGASVSHEPTMWEKAKNAAIGGAEALGSMVTGAVAKPVSDIAGLAAVPVHYAAGLAGVPVNADPEEVKRRTAEALTYQPKTETGQAINEAVGGTIGEAVNAITPQTSEQAGVSGTSLEGVARNVAHEAIPQAIGLALPVARGAKALATGEGVAAARAAVNAGSPEATQAAADAEKAANLKKDTVRTEAQAKGLRTPPESGIAAKLPGQPGIRKAVSEYNSEKMPELVKEDLGAKGSTADINDVYEGKKTEAYSKYKAVVDNAPPVMKATPEFKAKIGEMKADAQARLDSAPATNAPLKDSLKILSDYDKPDFNSKMAFENIKTLRNNANKWYSSPSSGPAELAKAATSREIADQLEGVFEDNLKGDTLKQFKDARVQLAKIHMYQDATNPETGIIDTKQITKVGEKNPKLLTGNAKLISNFGSHFPDAVQKVKGAVAPLSWLDAYASVGAAASGHVAPAVALVGGRMGFPAAARAGLLQSKTPSYNVGTKASTAQKVTQAITPAEAERARRKAERAKNGSQS